MPQLRSAACLLFLAFWLPLAVRCGGTVLPRTGSLNPSEPQAQQFARNFVADATQTQFESTSQPLSKYVFRLNPSNISPDDRLDVFAEVQPLTTNVRVAGGLCPPVELARGWQFSRRTALFPRAPSR